MPPKDRNQPKDQNPPKDHKDKQGANKPKK